MALYVGTSGWQYGDWEERFYPGDLPKKRWLEHFALNFATVESNSAFYRLPEKKTFEAWAERTPDDFVWAVKMSRFLTHVRRLREPAEPVSRFLERAEGLGTKLGPVLLQLPPNLKSDRDGLDAVLKQFPAAVHVAVEFRHESWFTDDTRALLEKRGAALCLADRGSQPVSPLWRTTEWGYVRFHEGASSPHPCYGRTALHSWTERIGELWAPRDDVYVYFNNDTLGCALRDARTFARVASRAGLNATRVPEKAIQAG